MLRHTVLWPVLALLLVLAARSGSARATPADATACAANLPPDAKAIFDKTLPQVTAGSDLRTLLTDNTRSLAMSGTISISSARQSATEASQCLQRVHG